MFPLDALAGGEDDEAGGHGMSATDTASPVRTQQQEVDRNYEAFKKVLPALLESDPGRTALMRDGEVIACFDTDRDAIEAGRAFFEDRPFSIQEITRRRVDLGYFSHAGVFGTP